MIYWILIGGEGMRSMTGYGRATRELDGRELSVERDGPVFKIFGELSID